MKKQIILLLTTLLFFFGLKAQTGLPDSLINSAILRSGNLSLPMTGLNDISIFPSNTITVYIDTCKVFDATLSGDTFHFAQVIIEPHPDRSGHYQEEIIKNVYLVRSSGLWLNRKKIPIKSDLWYEDGAVHLISRGSFKIK